MPETDEHLHQDDELNTAINFEISADRWHDWKKTVPRSKKLDERIRELVKEDAQTQTEGDDEQSRFMIDGSVTITRTDGQQETVEDGVAIIGPGDRFEANTDDVEVEFLRKTLRSSPIKDCTKYQFKIERETWDEWTKTVPDDIARSARLRELVMIDEFRNRGRITGTD